MQNYQIISLRKCILPLLILPITFSFTQLHPFFLSVTEISYNQDSKKMEISVKLFMDDFEKTLSSFHKTPVDLIHPKDPNLIEKQVADYISNQLSINSDGKLVQLKFIGYEKEGEALWSYFETEEISSPKTIYITNTLLYQYIEDQVNIIHVNIGAEKKSFKLNNPESKAEFKF